MKNPKPNVSKGKQKAMRELAKKKHIIVANADSGSAVAIMDAEKYFNEASRKLSDKRSNNLLQEDLKLKQSKLVNDTVDRFNKENLFSKKVAYGLKSVFPKTPKFYISPQIQKKNKPARPVIN